MGVNYLTITSAIPATLTSVTGGIYSYPINTCVDQCRIAISILRQKVPTSFQGSARLGLGKLEMRLTIQPASQAASQLADLAPRRS